MTLLLSFSGYCRKRALDGEGPTETAARKLSGWGGAGNSWFASCEHRKAGSLAAKEAGADGMAIANRGRIVEHAAKGLHGSGSTRALHRWNRSAEWVAIPQTASQAGMAGTLGFAKLDGPLEAILLLYAAEDWTQWPIVERYALACWDGRRELLAHAMAAIMWPIRKGDDKEWAKLMRMRKADYLVARRRAEQLLGGWLDMAAERFMASAKGNDRTLANYL
jgi:hypothetical protein